MAQDLKKMFNEDRLKIQNGMPKGHEARFLKKLDEKRPQTSIKKRFSMWNIAASVVVLLGLSYGAYQFFQAEPVIPEDKEERSEERRVGKDGRTRGRGDHEDRTRDR